MKHILFCAVAVTMFAGCQNVPAQLPDIKPITGTVLEKPKLTEFQQFASDDLDEAIRDATEKKDTVALECWNSAKVNLPTLNHLLPKIKGVATTIQAGRDVRMRLSAGLPPELLRACVNLAVQERKGLADLFLAFFGV